MPYWFAQHTVWRGINPQVCFNGDEDMAAYASWLKEFAEKHQVHIHAWVYHLKNFYFSMKKILLLLGCFLILSCTAAYRPYKHQQGYVVLPLSEKQFRIEYYSNNPNASKANWHTAAKQLCVGDAVVESEQNETLWRTVRTPVAGQMVDLGAQDFIYYGVATCQQSVSADVEISPTQWQIFNLQNKTNDFVSDKYIARTLKIVPSRLLGLTQLPKVNASASYSQHWNHKPRLQTTTGNRQLTLWTVDGDNGLPNNLIMIETQGCLESIYVLPPSLIVPKLATADLPKFEVLLKSGALTVYSLKLEKCP